MSQLGVNNKLTKTLLIVLVFVCLFVCLFAHLFRFDFWSGPAVWSLRQRGCPFPTKPTGRKRIKREFFFFLNTIKLQIWHFFHMHKHVHVTATVIQHYIIWPQCLALWFHIKCKWTLHRIMGNGTLFYLNSFFCTGTVIIQSPFEPYYTWRK